MIAIYARQSMDKKDSISIDTQIELCKREFNSENLDYKVYSDKGFSGKNIDRPSFTELLEAVRQNEITKVVVYRLDRISRSITDFATIMNLFEEHDVSFISSTEKFDTSAPMGKAMLYIIMVFAQLERETIAERIKDNYYSRGKNGVWLGGPAPLGFSNAKDTVDGRNVKVLKVNDDIEIVKEIFDAYANTNRSLGDIAREFQAKYGNAYGVWNNIKLSRILQNPTYVKANADIYRHYEALKCIMINDIDEYTGQKACFVFGKRDRSKNKYRNLDEHVVVLSLHDGIITPDIFLRCQDKLSRNKQIKNSGKGKHTWMTGLMKCPYCEHGFVVKIRDKKTAQKYLYCSGRQNNLCDLTHDTHPLAEIESYVEAKIIEELKKGTNKAEHIQKESPEVNDFKIRLYKIESQIETLIGNLTEANDVLIGYINKKITELDLEKKELQQKISAQSEINTQIKIPTLGEWENGGLEEKREIASSIISKIYVYDNNAIKILWKY